MIKKPNRSYRRFQKNTKMGMDSKPRVSEKFQKQKTTVNYRENVKKKMTIYQHIRRREYVKKLKAPKVEVVPIKITGRKKTKESLLKKKKQTRFKKKTHRAMMREQERVRQLIKNRPPRRVIKPKQRWEIPKKDKSHREALRTLPEYLDNVDLPKGKLTDIEFYNVKANQHVGTVDDLVILANFILKWFSRDTADSLFRETRNTYSFYKQFKLLNQQSVSQNLSVSTYTNNEEFTFEDAAIVNVINLYYRQFKKKEFGSVYSIRNLPYWHGTTTSPKVSLTKADTTPNHLSNFYNIKRKKKTKKYTDQNAPCPLDDITDAKRVRLNSHKALLNFQNLKDFETIVSTFKLEYSEKQNTGTDGRKLFKMWECEDLIWRKIWKLKHLFNLNKMKIIETKKVGPLGNRATKVLQLGCTKGGCFSTCQTLQKCTRALNRLPENIMQQDIGNPSVKDNSTMNSFLDNLQRGITTGHKPFPNRNNITPPVKHELKKPMDRPVLFGDIKLTSSNSSFCEYSKVIRTPGLSRSYHKKSVKVLSMADFTGLYRKGQALKIRIKRRKGTTRFENVKKSLNFLKNKGLVNLFETYVQQTKPALTYYLVRKRSYMKKRKVFINSFKLKIAKDFNRQNKLFHQIKTIYFRGRNRKTAGNITRSTKKFLSRELFKIGQNKLLIKKKQIYKNYGHDSMNELLLKFL